MSGMLHVRENSRGGSHVKRKIEILASGRSTCLLEIWT